MSARQRLKPQGPWHWREAEFELDWSGFIKTEQAKSVAKRRNTKLCEEGKDLSVSALKHSPRRPKTLQR